MSRPWVPASLTALLLALLPWPSAFAQPPLTPASIAPIHAAGLPSPGAATAVTASTTAVPASAAAGLSLDLEALVRISGRPPQSGSRDLQDDLAILRWLQSQRTPQGIASTWMTLRRDPDVFSAALGVDLAKSGLAITSGLRQFLALVDGASNRIKSQIQRPRPYLSHADLRPCLPPETGSSYPSGHANWYAAAARLLADLLPEQRQRLEAIGEHGGSNRVLCGVHYPSDVRAGQRLGRAAADQIIASPQWQHFRQDPAVRSELQQMLQSRPEALPLLLP
jgi:acid phosphatase (class A)